MFPEVGGVFSNEVSAVAKGYKDSIKLKKEEIDKTLHLLKEKRRYVTEDVYSVPDFDNGIMNICLENGEIIESRRLRPDEKQQTLPLYAAIN